MFPAESSGFFSLNSVSRLFRKLSSRIENEDRQEGDRGDYETTTELVYARTLYTIDATNRRTNLAYANGDISAASPRRKTTLPDEFVLGGPCPVTKNPRVIA